MQADLAELIAAAREAERSELRYITRPNAKTMTERNFRRDELARLTDEFQAEHLQGSFY